MSCLKSFYFYFIMILIFIVLLALVGIKGFLRLSPSIEKINNQNTRSLYYAENMMSALTVKKDIFLFEKALKQERNNITEQGELQAFKKIEDNYHKAFKNHSSYIQDTTNAIIELSSVNRIAMKNSAIKAKKNSMAGAWVITFFSFIICGFGLIFIKTLTTNLIKPIRELADVLNSYTKGNKQRRCPKMAPNKDFQKIYDSINKILDSNKM